jgi:hypothetical protein
MPVMSDSTSPAARLLAGAAARMGLVPRGQVRAVHAAHLELLVATAQAAWADGVNDAATAISDALREDGEQAAQEAPRGVLHSDLAHADTEALTAAAAAVEREMRELGLDDVFSGDRTLRPPYLPRELVVRLGNQAPPHTKLLHAARRFLLKSRGLSDQETLRRLGEPEHQGERGGPPRR